VKGTNPNNWDTDGDHLADGRRNGDNINFPDPDPLNPLDLNGDEDRDTISNQDEIDGWVFDLEYIDTAGNTHTENNKKVITKYDNNDTDGDGLLDNEEKQKGTDPTVTDTDGDGFSDKFETDVNYDPLNGDVNGTASAGYDGTVPPDADQDYLMDTFEDKYSQCGAGTGLYAMTGSFQDGFSTEILDCDVADYTLDKNDLDSNNNGIYDGNEDFDRDGLTNKEEQALGSNPTNWDSDGDEIPDYLDPNPTDSADILQDTDGDGYTDKVEILGINISYTYKINSGGTCIEKNFDQKVSLNYQKIDSDEDGLDDKFEVQNGLNPIIADIDLDGWKDGEEINLGTDAKNGCDGSNNIPVDNDGDGLGKTFEDKYTNGVNQGNKIFIKGGNVNGEDGTQSGFNLIDLPDGTNPNSDGDRVLDGEEDFDNDGLTNKEEQIKGTNPNNWDTDGDGIEDTLDVKPNNPGNIILPENYIFNSDIDSDIYGPDSDLDGLSDKYEIKIGTDPNNADSDNDGIPDGIEVAAKRLGD
ncbi:hypothetical protein LR002_02700, partial [Candidatus Gracilibacteria bacterium]|nr:hypothetical protein [Candidatus Gracilibacteria bacterium]